MKFPAYLLATLLITSVHAQTAPTPASPPTPPEKMAPPVKTGAVEKVDPAKNKAPAKPAKKEEPMGKIAGAEIARPDGTFLGLEVAGGTFKLSFYDKKKKPIPSNVTRATARWPNPRSPGDNRTVLNPSGNSLVGAKPVLPPYSFNVYLTLLRGEGDNAQAVESYVVPFRG